MIKQLVEIDFAKHLAKLENVIKDNDMILANVRHVSAGIYQAGEEDEPELTRTGSIGVPTGRYYEIEAKILVPFS